MEGDKIPSSGPIADFLTAVAMGESPVKQMGKSLNGMKHDAKAITDLPTAISDLNVTLGETNKIMIAFLEKF